MHYDELYHYGVKRRSGRYPWGSGDRPFQSEGGSRFTDRDMSDALKTALTRKVFNEKHTIPAGTTFYRVTSNKDETNRKGSSTYVSYLEPERNLYKSGYIKNRDNTKNVYERTMTAKEDIKVPSKKEVIDVVNKVVLKNEALRKECVNSFLKMTEDRLLEAWDRKVYEDPKYEKYTTSDDDYRKGYQKYFNDQVKKYGNMKISDLQAPVLYSLGTSPKTKEKIVSELQKKGYNAMTDYASVGGAKIKLAGKDSNFAPEGVDPLILFDSSVLTEGKSKKVSKKDEKNAKRSYYGEWQRQAQNAQTMRDILTEQLAKTTDPAEKKRIQEMLKEREWY